MYTSWPQILHYCCLLIVVSTSRITSLAVRTCRTFLSCRALAQYCTHNLESQLSFFFNIIINSGINIHTAVFLLLLLVLSCEHTLLSTYVPGSMNPHRKTGTHTHTHTLSTHSLSAGTLMQFAHTWFFHSIPQLIDTLSTLSSLVVHIESCSLSPLLPDVMTKPSLLAYQCLSSIDNKPHHRTA